MEIETYEGCFTIIKRSVKVKLASKILIEETLNFNSTFHAGPGEGTKLHARKNFCVFYPIELKLCSIKNFLFQTIVSFLFFDFNGFWRENDVTVLKANFQLSLMAQKVYDSERTH